MKPDKTSTLLADWKPQMKAVIKAMEASGYYSAENRTGSEASTNYTNSQVSIHSGYQCKQTLNDCRKAFEAWQNYKPFGDDGEYYTHKQNILWEGWQAGWKASCGEILKDNAIMDGIKIMNSGTDEELVKKWEYSGVIKDALLSCDFEANESAMVLGAGSVFDPEKVKRALSEIEDGESK